MIVGTFVRTDGVLPTGRFGGAIERIVVEGCLVGFGDGFCFPVNEMYPTPSPTANRSVNLRAPVRNPPDPRDAADGSVGMNGGVGSLVGTIFGFIWGVSIGLWVVVVAGVVISKSAVRGVVTLEGVVVTRSTGVVVNSFDGMRNVVGSVVFRCSVRFCCSTTFCWICDSERLIADIVDSTRCCFCCCEIAVTP